MKKTKMTHAEYLEYLRIYDPILYSELTSDPTGTSGDYDFAFEVIAVAVCIGIIFFIGMVIFA